MFSYFWRGFFLFVCSFVFVLFFFFLLREFSFSVNKRKPLFEKYCALITTHTPPQKKSRAFASVFEKFSSSFFSSHTSNEHKNSVAVSLTDHNNLHVGMSARSRSTCTRMLEMKNFDRPTTHRASASTFPKIPKTCQRLKPSDAIDWI